MTRGFARTAAAAALAIAMLAGASQARATQAAFGPTAQMQGHAVLAVETNAPSGTFAQNEELGLKLFPAFASA